ncbi:DLA class I histocompatibility antigen, A9/A9 alpha chain-like [Odontesthes bonariensis]|uniref:DLA class I histocompatibility antigen, A9/A9 alpha chain-like n=1 Tax=Odontesthes bonariensis TaxID=219752 RepID=UPI003F5843F3
MNVFFIRLVVGALLLDPVMSSGSGKHSLWVLASYISGPTQFPEFTAVVMLDDIQVRYYDSQINQLTRVGGGAEKGAGLDLGQEGAFILQEIFSNLRKRLNLVKDQMNLTAAGVHVQQRITGCELLPGGQPAFIMFRDGANGQDADSLQYNTTHFAYAAAASWGFSFEAMKQTYLQALYANIYLPFCARALRHLLDREKHVVMRRVRPRVRLMTKQVVGGARLTCLATDFYPRHINLTLQRDGVPVDADRLSGGSVLPNGNGLYQVRKALTIDGEELRRKHVYTCTAAHLSLDNRLDVRWRAESLRTHRVHVLSVPAVLVVAAALLMVLLWRRGAGSEAVTMETDEQTITDPQ